MEEKPLTPTAEHAYALYSNLLQLIMTKLGKTEVFLTLEDFMNTPTDRMVITEQEEGGLRVKIVLQKDGKKLIEVEKAKRSTTLREMSNMRAGKPKKGPGR